MDDYIRACRTTPKTDVQMFNFQKTKQEIEIFFKSQYAEGLFMTDTETLLGVVNNRLKLEGIPPIERKRKKKEHKYICKYCGTKCCDPNNICYACSGKLGAFRKIKNMKPKEVVK